jgi:ATP-dependent DNA helicase HFM1/MER3
MQFNVDVSNIFQHAARLIRCIIDCQLHLGDSVGARNALSLSRSLAARAWEDSPLQLKQIEGIGPVAVHKLAQGGIRTIEVLESQEPARIEMLLSKNPPWGHHLLDKLKSFPKLRVSLQMKGYTQGRPEDGVHVNVKAEIGFLNDKAPIFWQKKPVYVCFLAETSDGKKVHFCRIGAAKLGSGQDVFFTATLVDVGQIIACYIMCDDIGKLPAESHLSPTHAL